MDVTYRQIIPDVSPESLSDIVCGSIKSGVFQPYGSVALYFYKKQREFNKSKNKNKKHVYFIQDETGNVKIGIAEDIQSRLNLLQTGNSQKLKVVKTIRFGCIELEKQLHEKYKKYHIRGEWFTNEVLTF